MYAAFAVSRRRFTVNHSDGTMHAYCAEVWRRRYFWLSLVKIDLQRRYRRSVLGIGWSLLHPILMTCVFCVVFAKLFGESLTTYAPFVLSGLAFWSFISAITAEGCQCFYNGETYIRQHPTPLAIYPLRTTLGLFIHFGIAMLLLMILVWSLRGFENLWTLWSLVPALAILFVLAWSVATCVGMLNVLFPDMQHLIQIGMQALFYLTPVIYSGKMLERHRLQWLMDCNPLAACIELLRAPILDARLANWQSWCFASVVTAIFGVAAALILARMQRRLIYYL
jgi:lipopolysaccharide transport system permease protein